MQADTRQHLRQRDPFHRGVGHGLTHSEEPGGDGGQRHVVRMARRFPLVALPRLMQAGWGDDQGAIGEQVEPWARIKFAQRVPQGKVVMGAFAATEGQGRLRQRAVGLGEVLERVRAAVVRIHIEHYELRALARLEADVGMGPLLPPGPDLCRVGAGCGGPLTNARVLARLTVVGTAGADPGGHVMERDHVPAFGRIGQGRLKQGVRLGCGHSPPLCAVDVVPFVVYCCIDVVPF